MGRIGEMEDDAHSRSQAEASCFPHHEAKRRALDPAFSQVSSSPGPVHPPAKLCPGFGLLPGEFYPKSTELAPWTVVEHRAHTTRLDYFLLYSCL
ncbi:hypothetical protein PR202_ga27816 [Eleusine coracana subsp. coracana]|uniref:Uncharacterized protein n=1 Tax=Eleusine coracana subsp. coracana TaxID=191504 RepID=A0AAV5DH85_ELECO|nr:hypothetical protein PR202_ga27816 [Eleusine coracana subsp. coracana]